jgi:hypothetical protein
MRKLIILIVFTLMVNSIFAKDNLQFINQVNTVKYKKIFSNDFAKKNKSLFCGVAEAQAAISQAYANEFEGFQWCMGVHSTGAGLTDCFHYFHNVREMVVAFIYNNYEDCPPEQI